MNTDELESALMRAEIRVLKIQTKLHQWARDDPHRRFDDLFNLVADPAFLLVGWDRVRSNRGARTAGVDGRTAVSIQTGQGVEDFLDRLRTSLKDRSFRPLPVRERMIPKAGGKLRRLGIATITDRVVQASLKLVLSNVALSVLDEHIAQAPGGPGASAVARAKRRRHGLANYRLVRYADDWCLAVSGTAADAEALKEEIAGVLTTVGLRLSVEKTLITHVDEGLDFLGWHIQRRRKRGTDRHYVYTYPSRKAVKSVMDKVKKICRQNRNLPLKVLLHRLNSLLRGWTTYFRSGVSSTAFNYLRAFTWRQVFRWLRRKHPRVSWKELRRRFCGGGWWPADEEVTLFNPGAAKTTRYRYRGTNIPSPWPATP